MKKKLLSLSVALVLMVCSVLSPSLTAFADTESESSAAAEAELFTACPTTTDIPTCWAYHRLSF